MPRRPILRTPLAIALLLLIALPALAVEPAICESVEQLAADRPIVAIARLKLRQPSHVELDVVELIKGPAGLRMLVFQKDSAFWKWGDGEVLVFARGGAAPHHSLDPWERPPVFKLDGTETRAIDVSTKPVSSREKLLRAARIGATAPPGFQHMDIDAPAMVNGIEGNIVIIPKLPQIELAARQFAFDPDEQIAMNAICMLFHFGSSPENVAIVRAALNSTAHSQTLDHFRWRYAVLPIRDAAHTILQTWGIQSPRSSLHAPLSQHTPIPRSALIAIITTLLLIPTTAAFIRRHRRLPRFFATLSLALLVILLVLWFRSYKHSDELTHATPHAQRELFTHRGHFLLTRTVHPHPAHPLAFATFPQHPLRTSLKNWPKQSAKSFLNFELIDGWLPNPNQPGLIRYRAFVIPMWAPALFLLPLPTLWLAAIVRRHRRRKHNLCTNCGYDLRHSTNRCPECGAGEIPIALGKDAQ